MSNFMQKVKRKWNIQKLGVQLVGIEAMAYYLLVGVSVLLVALLVSVRIFFAYDITNSDYTMYLNFFDGEADVDLYLPDCRILDFEGNWMKVSAETRKGHMEKLIPVSSVLSMELVSEAES